MAASRRLDRFLENVDEKVLECSICFKRLQNPKSLNCLHSFCLACLEDWVKEKGKLTCPTCSKSYPIPEGGLQKLPPNTFLNTLLETIEQFSEKDQIKCNVCEKERELKYYCQDCRQYLCSTCSDQHKKFKAMANHKLHLMEDVQSMSPSQMTLLHPPLCSHHSKPLEFYCTDCKTPICVNCILMDHNAWDGKHKSITIFNAFQTFEETSVTLEKSSQHFIKKIEDGLKVVIENATKLDQCKDACLRDIDNHVEEILKKVRENRDKMKNEVETIYKRKKKVNDVQMEELKTTISDINTKLSFLNQLLKSDEGTAMQSSERVITALKDRINELPKTEPDDNGQIYFLVNKQQIDSLKQCDIGTLTQQLRAADCLTLKGEESVGQGQIIVVKIIKTNEYEIIANQMKVKWTHPTGQTNISQVQKDEYGDYFVTGKCTIPGVCKLDVSADGEPINQSPMKIKVEEGRLVNSIKTNKTVRDVVKCEDDCLLLSCKTNEMLKYKQSGEYIGKVTLPQGVQVDRMYKMMDGDIAFSDCNGNKPITICNMNGQVIKAIGEGVLGGSYGIHVDETSNVLYVADWDNCVYMFDMNNGQIIKRIRSCGKKDGRGKKEGQMSSAIDVTLTKQGHLLVLEFGNSRLQLFDNKGRFIKVLVEAGDENGKLRYPSGVVVDEDDIIISSQHKLQKFSSDGNFIKRIDKPEDGINNPQGLSIISHYPRRLAVANKGDKTVKIFNY